MNFKTEIKGITLIALVVTIIVLLILAGVTIAMLTGENGILNQANDAKQKTERAEAKERAQLDVAAYVADEKAKGETGELNDSVIKGILTGKDYVKEVKDTSFISKKGNHEILYSELYGTGNSEIPGGDTGKLPPPTDETAPYLPDDGSTVIEDDYEKGIVVKDKNNNEWVWIEVPKSVTASANTDGDIKNALINYVGKDVYRKDGYDDTYQSGLGIDEPTYNSNYSAMLQSIKANGGFWIGRYEMGLETDTPRTEATKDNLTGKALSQADKIPYNYITVSQAQQLAQEMNPNESKNISSIMYGIQWDLVCKYIESKNQYTKDGTNTLIDQTLIKSDSTKWGNYYNATFNITKGKFSEDDGDSFNPVDGSYTKAQNKSVLLTTGATERNSVLNIYDFAGNGREWTLEKNTNSSDPCVCRDGGYFNDGSVYPASSRVDGTTSYTSYGISSRPTLFSRTGN